MQLQVITSDGRRGQVATTVLEATAFRPVVVQFPDGNQQQYYLRELQVAEQTDREKQAT